MQRKTYMEAFISGEATVADVNKYRNEWSLYLNDSLDLSCAEYLGLSDYEYRVSKGGCCHMMMTMIAAVHKGMILDY
jgi:hypothetical protein